MKRSKFVKDLCKLVSIQSESYKTARMMKHISKVVQSIPGCATNVDEYGNLYVTKGDGPYKCMVCHTDTVHDIVMGKLAKCITIGVTWGYNSRESLIDADPDFIADELDQLFTFLKTEKILGEKNAI